MPREQFVAHLTAIMMEGVIVGTAEALGIAVTSLIPRYPTIPPCVERGGRLTTLVISRYPGYWVFAPAAESAKLAAPNRKTDSL